MHIEQKTEHHPDRTPAQPNDNLAPDGTPDQSTPQPNHLPSTVTDLLTAIQFLTRLPVPELPFAPDSLARSTKFFPLVGLLIGGIAAAIAHLLTPHLTRPVAALTVVLSTVLLTGGLHEDGLADAADGFGGGHTPARILAILRDSRIGTYGALALLFSVAARTLLLASISPQYLTAYLIAAHVLCRWTTLPLSRWLPPARGPEDGQGARIANLTSTSSLWIGSLLALAVTLLALRQQAAIPLLLAAALTYLTGRFYRAKIGGVTGDCFGATNQLVEVAVYLCGAWLSIPGAWPA